MKISFSIPLKGRTFFLKKTLISNITNALGVLEKDTVEFVLINLDSPDDIDQWVEAKLNDWIREGVVSYYKLQGSMPIYNISLAGNIAAKASSGDVISNFGADVHYAPHYFSQLPVLLKEGMYVGAPPSRENGTHGVLTFFKSDFELLGGYDEDMTGWGHMDTDLEKRAACIGLKKTCWDRNHVLEIAHSNDLRVKYSPFQNQETSQYQNAAISNAKIAARQFVANVGKTWGDKIVERVMF